MDTFWMVLSLNLLFDSWLEEEEDKLLARISSISTRTQGPVA